MHKPVIHCTSFHVTRVDRKLAPISVKGTPLRKNHPISIRRRDPRRRSRPEHRVARVSRWFIVSWNLSEWSDAVHYAFARSFADTIARNRETGERSGWRGCNLSRGYPVRERSPIWNDLVEQGDTRRCCLLVLHISGNASISDKLTVSLYYRQFAWCAFDYFVSDETFATFSQDLQANRCSNTYSKSLKRTWRRYFRFTCWNDYSL